MFDDGKACTEVERAVAAFAATRVEAAFLACLAGILAGTPDEFPAVHTLTIAPFSAIIKSGANRRAVLQASPPAPLYRSAMERGPGVRPEQRPSALGVAAGVALLAALFVDQRSDAALRTEVAGARKGVGRVSVGGH